MKKDFVWTTNVAASRMSERWAKSNERSRSVGGYDQNCLNACLLIDLWIKILID